MAIPLTFHIRQAGSQDSDYMAFLKVFNELKKKNESYNVWIIKPGEDTNRGTGI
jgi:tubulin polyglutamylase TTLL1